MADISGLLSMCRKAGRLVLGMDEVKSSCLRHEARCVLTASDFSDNSLREIERICLRTKIKMIDLPDTMDGIAAAVGKRCGVMSVTDKGFAEAIAKKLSSKQNNL